MSRQPATVSDENDLVVIALMSLEGIGPASASALLHRACESGRPLAEILQQHAHEMAALGLPPTAARAAAGLRSPVAKGRAIRNRLAGLGARPLFAHGRNYPTRLRAFLGRHTPPVLFVAGRAELLHGQTLAIVGSRHPSRRAVELARSFAAAQAAYGAAVVSGCARGIDQLGHEGALSTGATVFVPPMGLARFCGGGLCRLARTSREWAALGQFPPWADWRTQYALRRNRTIAALSDAVVAFEPRDTGGTWHTCRQALQLHKPLFVVNASAQAAKRRGLTHLVRMGAVALDPAGMPAAAEFARMVVQYRPPLAGDQLALFAPDPQ